MLESSLSLNENVSVSPWRHLRQGPIKVAIIGSGNWGSAVAKLVGTNTSKAFFFADQVNMWVHEEMFNGEKLSEIINTRHINEKYLPGVELPKNVKAVPDLRECVQGAHVLVFVVPHQYIKSVCQTIQGHVRHGAKAVSLVKGFESGEKRIHLISEFIRKALAIECSSLSGANVAKDVAKEEFAEATIGYENIESAQLLQQLFHTPYFRVNCVPDVAGVEICGALKNIVALAAGFCDGLGYGSNTKAALLRIGLQEIRLFAVKFYKGVIEETFWESCGMADLITTCYGGRNRRVAEAFVRTGRPWTTLEKTMLNGQKLQGTHTCRDTYAFLMAQGAREDFPLFTTVYKIVDCGLHPSYVVKVFMSSTPNPIIREGTIATSKL